MASAYFTKDTFQFLNNLSANNNRDWFNENKQLFEDAVRSPALHFITDIADDLARQSRHFIAQPKKVGGSLMRIHRDVRFSKDKQPYKTNIGIQFRHERGKDVHAPGFYLHIDPAECFLGVGIWRPDSTALGKIREYISDNPKRWHNTSSGKAFRSLFDLTGETLIRPPRGYDKDHPLIEDLKRKDFIAIAPINKKQVLEPEFIKAVSSQFKKADDYMHLLCDALQLQY